MGSDRRRDVAPGGDARSHHTLGLEVMTEAVRYRRYLLDLIEPQCGRTILEVGSGLGDLAADLRGYDRLIVTDVDPVCLRDLLRRFENRPRIQVQSLDLRGANPEIPPVETVIAVNVLEHIVDDAGALRRMAEIVVPGGNIVLFVPGYPSLYGPHDRAAGHVRRYVPETLDAVVTEAGLTVEILRPVNFLGGIAWWLAVRLGGCSSPRRSLVRLYDRLLVPVVCLLEQRWRPPFGQSVFCVARVSDRAGDAVSSGASDR